MSWSISGTGAIASIASGSRALFEALCAGRSGLAPLRGLDADRLRLKQAYEIDDGPDAEPTGRATRWLCEVIAEAVADAGLPEDLSEVPVLVGTGLREKRSVELRWTGQADFPLSRQHFGLALRERFGAVETYTIDNACSASLYALGLAADLIDSDAADTVVVAGVDSLTSSMFGLMDRVQTPPVDRVRPFDRERRGALMGEGAAAVVLSRGLPARARLRAVALNCDAHHETIPDVAGVSTAIADAHAAAGVRAEDIDVVIAHATGTLLNDDTEATALAKTFLSAGADPLVTGIKSMTGHTSGASGLMSLVVAAEVLHSGRIPPIVGLEHPSEAARALRLVTEPHREADVRLVQVDAFGFGGVNAVAIVERGDS
jgi:3-oxoacyl-[acyl-carrier-protein] synthase II